MQIKKADIVIGLQYGDEGKGKVTASIVSQRDYDLTARYNGGPNAGHSVMKKSGAHYSLHQIPTSVAFQKPGHIGPGTVFDIEKLLKEMQEFKKVEGIDPAKYLTISPKAIIITTVHKSTDLKYHYVQQGSTKSGIAPCYADFYNRTGNLMGNKGYLTKTYHSVDKLLLEGAQGFYLDPFQGKYPYTTSSASHPAAAAVTFGFSIQSFRHIIGVAKCYETRSGNDPYFNNIFKENEFTEKNIDFSETDRTTFNLLQKEGKEFGVTTGRKRQVRYLCLNRLINSIQATGTTIAVLNKWDILDKLNVFKLVVNNTILSFSSAKEMFQFVQKEILQQCLLVRSVIFSANPIMETEWHKTELTWDGLI